MSPEQTLTAPPAPPAPARQSITEVETYGVERIPDADRDARPLDLFRVCFGGANTFATSVLGAFPILFGLSFWQGAAATAPRAGARRAGAGADGAVRAGERHQQRGVSSCAHLGVHGRVVGLVPVAADRRRVLLASRCGAPATRSSAARTG